MSDEIYETQDETPIEDIYNSEEELLDNDEITLEEESFMRGYEKCQNQNFDEHKEKDNEEDDFDG